MKLVAAILDRDVETPWGRFRVRSPRVGEALVLMAAAEGAANGEPVQVSVFWEVLEDWLPAELVDRLKDVGLAVDVIRWVMGVLREGEPAAQERKPRARDDSKPVYKSRDEWEDLVADYMHVYAISLRETLLEPWAGFQLMVQKMAQVTARDQFRYIEAKGLPYIKDPRERDEAFADLRERGNLPVIDKEADYQRKLRLQTGWLNDLKGEYEIYQRTRRGRR